MKKVFTRGRFAKMNGVSLFTLRLYDKLGILKPSFTDSNGYHLYTDEQSHQLLFIEICIKSGFSLKEIQLMQNKINTSEELIELLYTIHKRIKQKQQEYTSCERMISSMIYYNEVSSQNELDHSFLEEGILYHGFISEKANYFLHENIEMSHEFINQTEKNMGHPIEFPISYLLDTTNPDFENLQIIIRTHKTYTNKNFYYSPSNCKCCIKSIRSNVEDLQEKVSQFIEECEEKYQIIGELLLTPVQVYMFRPENQQVTYVIGIPVRLKVKE